MIDKILLSENNPIENRIFTIRGVPVMLDSDLSKLYQVETKVLNQAVKRNLDRFPDLFFFRLNENEWKSLRSQIVTLKGEQGQHRKYFPLVFTEQGVAMLSAVLKSEVAVKVSVQIMNAFVMLRRTGIYLAGFQQRLEWVERKQLSHEVKFDQVFKALEQADPIPHQGIFYDGQIFDAYVFASDIIKKAKQTIMLVDNYVDESTLALLSKRKENVQAIIYSQKWNPTLQNDLSKLAAQYQPVEFRILKNTHDRFLIIDHKEMYHLGASLKDLGKKLFAFSRMDTEIRTLFKILEV